MATVIESKLTKPNLCALFNHLDHSLDATSSSQHEQNSFGFFWKLQMIGYFFPAFCLSMDGWIGLVS